MKKYQNVDDYIVAHPESVQALLRETRRAITGAAPAATEKISYGMPYYSFNGRLLYFAAHQHHIGLYPMKSALRQFKKELSGYPTSAGTVRFPFDKPLPLELIRKIVEFRVQENQAKKK